ncbi:hypothetical protein BDN71DRAFT_743937 [Pleurotus eryngii]|uniref:Fungal lipase-like domain-containing protein n=1 Tax=Pleurotus eryngii TaxID=5323 RepID=A0A9P6A1P3_PLEER|nr:hypothetical protein BDN71DRAFT_743937 [Pleurotus eryngii]
MVLIYRSLLVHSSYPTMCKRGSIFHCITSVRYTETKTCILTGRPGTSNGDEVLRPPHIPFTRYRVVRQTIARWQTEAGLKQGILGVTAVCKVLGCGIPRPAGVYQPLNTAVARYDNKSTQTILVRYEEFVLASRGTEPTKGDGDCSADAQICKTPLAIPGVTGSDLQVHSGSHLESEEGAQVEANLRSGHSLGGAIAALASLEIKTVFPKLNLRLFSYGS